MHTGHRAVGFEQTEDIARVTFGNGAVAEADVVIGADGIHSELRPFVFPPSAPVFHGTVAYRGLLALDRIPDWPNDRWLMWLGTGKHFLTFPVRHGTLINYVGFVPADQEMTESWSAPGDPDVLRSEFTGWDPRIEGLLAKVEKTFRWALYDREPLPGWTRGRLTLLGDAAHPMLPHLGQGANQSIEDGMALATILSRADRANVQPALQAYERLRRERVAQVQRGARENGMRYDFGLLRPWRPRRRDHRACQFPQASLRLRRGAGRASGGDSHRLIQRTAQQDPAMADLQVRFDDGAAYERMIGTWSRIVGSIFLDWAALPSGAKCIDVGCGNGVFTELLIDRCAPAEVYGIDPSEGQLAFARTRPAARFAKFQKGDAQALDFPDNRFDVATMALVIVFVPTPAKGVAEMARVVRPGGTVAAYMWDQTAGGLPHMPILQEIRAMGLPVALPPNAELSRLEAMRDLWAGAGLVDIETTVISAERAYPSFDDMWATSVQSGTMAQTVAGMDEAKRNELKDRVRALYPPEPTAASSPRPRQCDQGPRARNSGARYFSIGKPTMLPHSVHEPS